ncbi:MAG: SDR family NAD(P)-dependent oxidoreductase, partial [Tistlia sp.]
MNEHLQPPQQQDQPGDEREMTPEPDCRPRFPGSGRLADKVALISGGDSGIGRAVALAMAREGAAVAILYLDETEDAEDTVRLVEEEGRPALAIAGDIGDEAFCRDAVAQTLKRFGRLDVLVNNAAEQHETDDFAQFDTAQMERTFRTNIFSFFYLTKAAMPHL